MTLQQARAALAQTRLFLQRLADSQANVPEDVRQEALRLLQQLPCAHEVQADNEEEMLTLVRAWIREKVSEQRLERQREGKQYIDIEINDEP